VLLPALEQSLKAWLRESLPLSVAVGDISFDSPAGTWGAAINRPTLNLFLFDISRASRPSVLLPTHHDRDGALVQGPPAPSVAFSYLVSAWGGGVREEHGLLGDVLRCVLRSPCLAPVPPAVVAPVQLGLAESSEARARDLWGGLGGHLRAGMVLVATTAVPVGAALPVAPPVTDVEAEVRRFGPDEEGTAPARLAGEGADSVPDGEAVLTEELGGRRSGRQGSRVLRWKARS
jgi:hypothetical protein